MGPATGSALEAVGRCGGEPSSVIVKESRSRPNVHMGPAQQDTLTEVQMPDPHVAVRIMAILQDAKRVRLPLHAGHSTDMNRIYRRGGDPGRSEENEEDLDQRPFGPALPQHDLLSVTCGAPPRCLLRAEYDGAGLSGGGEWRLLRRRALAFSNVEVSARDAMTREDRKYRRTSTRRRSRCVEGQHRTTGRTWSGLGVGD